MESARFGVVMCHRRVSATHAWRGRCGASARSHCHQSVRGGSRGLRVKIDDDPLARSSTSPMRDLFHRNFDHAALDKNRSESQRAKSFGKHFGSARGWKRSEGSKLVNSSSGLTLHILAKTSITFLFCLTSQLN